MARPHVFEPLLRDSAGCYRLINRTNGIVLAEAVETAFDSRSRRTGLLGRETLGTDAVLAIAPCNAVHTFGMRFPIDVVFVTRAGHVTKRVQGLRPGRIAASLSAFAVLEFAAGHPAVAATAVGDRLAVDTSPDRAGEVSLFSEVRNALTS
jgi:uncharacterized membrane protein (UPF0127 family)